MATIPSFEKILLEIHQSLELGLIQSKTKNKFADLGYSMETQARKQDEFIADIFRALDMDSRACQDAIPDILDWASFHKALELHTWTSNADERQVLWHLLGYSYAPALGRCIATWNLDGAFDTGMAGGKFWFLPVIETKTGKLRLPVPQVLDWLLDLLGRPMDEARDQLGGACADRVGNQESIERNLYNWLTGNIPSAAKIAQYFPDDATIDFKGVFELQNDLSDEAQFTAAREFVRTVKGLEPEALRDEIPMTQPGRLEAIFDGTAPSDEKALFVELVRTRYTPPSMRTVRQRLLVARMVQDGYRRLLKLLCPSVDECCPDPRKNKLLQVIAIFQASYNLTIAARKNCGPEGTENAWFEAQLAPWDRADLFLAVLPSRKGRAPRDLAALLSRRFAKLADGAPLDDLFGLDAESALPIIKRRIERLKTEAADDLRYENLIDRVRCGSPWRALQAEDDYWVVSQIAQNRTISPHARQMAIKRMLELSANHGESLGAIMIQLGTLLNARCRERPKDVQQKVEALLKIARESPARAQWNAALLQYEAKHVLAQNDFAGAGRLFREALEACSERNFGQLRGEIARDTFATEVANQKLIPGNHEKYHRNMLAYGMFEGGEHGLEDTAVWVADYFWSDLYKPYPGVERLNPVSAGEAERYIKEAFPLIVKADWDGLQGWMKGHSKSFQKSTLREARGNTVLMAWIKMEHAFAGIQPNLKAMTPPHLHAELAKFQTGLANWNKAITLLIGSWPGQVNIADFKGQTPLMLVADAGDVSLTSAFIAAGADVNAQDYKGRTALHAAITSRSEHCVNIVLASNPDVRRTTISDKQSVLHTAVRMGQPTIVRMVLERDRGLKFMENVHGQTPLALVEDILADLPKFQTEMAEYHRRIGTRDDFKAIGAILKADETIH